MSYKIIQIDKRNIKTVEPLWLELNTIHQQGSPYFRKYYESFTFLKRIEKFLMIPDDNLLIEIVENNKNVIGYCISTIIKDVGEIESLFISEQERGKGLGERLVNRSIDWMKKRKCSKIQVSVSYGRESVFSFYEKFGLFPRLTILQMTDL